MFCFLKREKNKQINIAMPALISGASSESKQFQSKSRMSMILLLFTYFLK